MTALLESENIRVKTRELCQMIASDPAFVDLRRQVETFLADEKAKTQFQTVTEKGETLHEKQHAGVKLSEEEVADYENHRQALLLNPIAQAFLDAREQLSQVQQSVTQHVNKTLELGRVPEPADFEGGSCGHGCGCHH